jgi:RNA polymerase sigma-70 factor (ECF subfamily)
MQREQLLQCFVRDRGHYLGFLRVLCRDLDWAEDLFQELSIEVMEHVDRYDAQRDFGAWVRGIARNLYRKSAVSRQKANPAYDPQLLEMVTNAYEGRDKNEEEERREQVQYLRRCLAAISQNHREMLRQRYEQNFSTAQIASNRQKTVSAVDTAICRIRSALLRCIEQQGRVST